MDGVDDVVDGEPEVHCYRRFYHHVGGAWTDHVDAGLVSRTQYDEIPPRVEYSLTEDGDEVRRRLEPPLE